jgi:hypothetical protein
VITMNIKSATLARSHLPAADAESFLDSILLHAAVPGDLTAYVSTVFQRIWACKCVI